MAELLVSSPPRQGESCLGRQADLISQSSLPSDKGDGEKEAPNPSSLSCFVGDT